LKALQFFTQALAMEPDNAVLRALLANVNINLAGSGYLTIQECFARARAEAEKAIALDDHLADGYTALGRIKQVYDWDWVGAEADYEKAYELDSSNADVIHRKASFARTLGKFDESIALFHKAINTDPVNVKHYMSLGIAYENAHRFEEAKSQFRKALELIPGYRSAHSFIGAAYLFQGKPDSAMMEIQREIHPIWKASYLPAANYALGNKAEADKLLQEFITTHQVDWAFQIAQNYAYRGDGDKTFFWLERAYEQHDGGLPELKGDPFFDKIKNDPRYLVFMKKMKLM
jgi:tetratricopeptide (TPR) repeat protein